MSIKIGLAGNPNCGKTTMFNELTGSSQYVGNWPGVTVEKKEGKLKGHKDVTIVDLPGIYSLSPYTLEEVVTRKFMLEDKPDAIINIVDASNIERNLYLTTQILELGIPTVVALNMMDILEKRGDKIDVKKLSKDIGCPVIETTALKADGINKVSEKAIELAKSNKEIEFDVVLPSKLEQSIKDIEHIISKEIALKEGMRSRWLAIKLFERDSEIIKEMKITKDILEKIEEIIVKAEKEFDDDSEGIIISSRYDHIGGWVSNSVKKSKIKETTSDKIDKIVTNRFLALQIFATIMWFVYYVAVSSIGSTMTDWVNDTLVSEIIQGNVGTWLENMNVADWLIALINDGIIGGVGSVIGFVPQIAVLFLLLSILEDCGYMSRVAFIMDKVFRKLGLSGKSFIPMLISSGCGVPGIMATRTIESDRDRKMTIMLTTFIPCSAKVPIIALFAGALFGGASWVAPAVYFFSIILIIICALILKRTRLFVGDAAPFVMELPQYHLPSVRSVIIHVWDRVKAFIKKAGTVIFAACGIIWFLSSFNWSLEMVDASESILAAIGNVIAPIFTPLGFGNWQSAVSTITGFVAKENVVGTFGVLLGVADAAENDPTVLQVLPTLFTSASGIAFIVFNMINPPCFAAVGAIRREMGSWKWTFITLGFQTITAYTVALVINQVGSFILGYGTLFGAATSVIVAIALVLAVLISAKRVKSKSLSYGLS